MGLFIEKPRLLARSRRVPGTRSHLVITAIRFHAPLMQTRSYWNSIIPQQAFQQAASKSAFDSLFRRHRSYASVVVPSREIVPSRLWTIRELPSIVPGTMLKWLLSRLSTSHRAYLTHFVEGPAGCNNVVSSASARISDPVGAGAVQCNENYIAHYRKRSRLPNVPQVIIR